jgi:hypothetical protein
MSRETLISKLKDDLAHGCVVTITSTDVSVAACGNQGVNGFKVATWTGLLRHGTRHCRDTGLADDNDVEILTRKSDSGQTRHLISAAEDISQRLREHGAGVFRGWLQDTIGQLKVVEPAILEAVATLPRDLAQRHHLAGAGQGSSTSRRRWTRRGRVSRGAPTWRRAPSHRAKSRAADRGGHRNAPSALGNRGSLI